MVRLVELRPRRSSALVSISDGSPIAIIMRSGAVTYMARLSRHAKRYCWRLISSCVWLL